MFKLSRDLTVLKLKEDKSSYSAFCTSALQNEVKVFSNISEICIVENEYLINVYFKYFYSQCNIIFLKLEKDENVLIWMDKSVKSNFETLLYQIYSYIYQDI